MAQVAITINGRNYQVACDDGQEHHLKELATYVDKRVSELVSALGQVGDLRLLVMTSLLMADELTEAQTALHSATQSGRSAGQQAELSEMKAASVIDSLAGRIELIAERLERL